MAAILTALGACGGSANHGTPGVPSPSGTSVATPAPGQLKPVLSGLLDRTGAPLPEYYGTLAGYVVNVHWGDLQPAQGGPIAANNAIDQAIAQVRGINASAHMHLGIKVRIYSGLYAPEWAKRLGGSPIPVADPQTAQNGTIGRFWTDAFGQAYATLQAELAAQYDQVPEVREVTISRCMTVFAEPFIRDIASPSTVQALVAAGFSAQADVGCQQGEITAHLAWHHTRSDLSFNPYQVINSDGSTGTDEGFTEQMMDYCRKILGRACVLGNNSLRTKLPPAYVAMYAKMQSLGPPLAIQTATLGRVGDLNGTLAYAVTLGANSVELPSGYQATPATSLQDAERSLSSNPAPG